jgi:hypothetical protein
MAFPAGQRLTANYLNSIWPATVTNRQDTDGSTASTTYTATLTGGTAAGVAFIAPLSGKVLINFGTASYCVAAQIDMKSAVQVREGSSVGSGTIFYAVTDSDMILTHPPANTATRHASFAVVTGLTPGSSYNAQMLHRVSANTGQFLFKFIEVAPIPM